jgi:hypothetical protein
MDTRKDLNISTCGFVDGVDAEAEEAFSVLEPPESGGSRSRSSGLGVGCGFRSGREESGAGVERGSRFRSDTAVESDCHVLV